MTYEELITYYTSVTLIDSEWRAHCYIEAYNMEGDYVEELGTIDARSIFGPADVLRLMADEIELWEKENIEPYKSAKDA